MLRPRVWGGEVLTQEQGSIMSAMLPYDPATIASTFRKSFERSLGSAEKAQLVMTEYGIREESDKRPMTGS